MSGKMDPDTVGPAGFTEHGIELRLSHRAVDIADKVHALVEDARAIAGEHVERLDRLMRENQAIRLELAAARAEAARFRRALVEATQPLTDDGARALHHVELSPGPIETTYLPEVTK